MITAAVRLSDGMVVDVQISTIDVRGMNVGARVRNAMAEAGGEAEDWAVYQIPDALWVEIDPLATQYVTIENEAVVAVRQGEPYRVVDDEPGPSKADLQAQLNALQAQINAMPDDGEGA